MAGRLRICRQANDMNNAQTNDIKGNPHSPLSVAQKLLEDFLEQRVSAQQFLAATQRFSGHINNWKTNLSTLSPPEDIAESKVLLQGVEEGITKILIGIESLGRLSDETSMERAQSALNSITEGQNLLLQVKQITEQTISNAIAEAGYMD